MTADNGRSAGPADFEAEVYRSRYGYTLILHRPDGAFPVLAADGRRLMRWRRLEAALAFMAERIGKPGAIRLNLYE